jgi:hypothetical protein
MKMVYVARRLNTMEEPGPYLFVTAIYRGTKPQPRKFFPDSSPGVDNLCNSKSKHDKRTRLRTVVGL